MRLPVEFAMKNVWLNFADPRSLGNIALKGRRLVARQFPATNSASAKSESHEICRSAGILA